MFIQTNHPKVVAYPCESSIRLREVILPPKPLATLMDTTLKSCKWGNSSLSVYVSVYVKARYIDTRLQSLFTPKMRTLLSYAAHKHARSNFPSKAQSRKVHASMRSSEKYAHIDAQSRKVGACLLFWTDLDYPTKLLFLRVLGALECAICENQW